MSDNTESYPLPFLRGCCSQKLDSDVWRVLLSYLRSLVCLTLRAAGPGALCRTDGGDCRLQTLGPVCALSAGARQASVAWAQCRPATGGCSLAWLITAGRPSLTPVCRPGPAHPADTGSTGAGPA